ncbi:PQQ-binding-like beta-propeller repeat protein [Metallosphaera tengchongensis]|uniref:PQQ-binding-like beta-propeller repeat protein n=1 Tax=Metallosphaera tengchongensis TaxID=1532350 RepID=A0A6N0NVG4_9CREN|nr:PQQ-binding-like beta-propeller repeat protein [Metallosphaera tengchongensis]QKR00806.1 PQQ-binding-like beta-propeller repeat protein [Metallosphaera tengchongensis]
MQLRNWLGVVIALIVGLGIGTAVGFLYFTSHVNSNGVQGRSPSVLLYKVQSSPSSLYTVDGFPVCVTYFQENSPGLTNGSWTLFDNSTNRVPSIPGELNVSWVFQQEMPAFQLGNISGWVNLIKDYTPQFREGYVQMMGDAVPPSYANGMVYIAASDGFLYAIDAENGKPVFIDMIPSTLMSQPLIYHDIVYVGLGGAFFTYGQGLLNAYGGGHRGQFTGLSGLMALNASDGRPIWFFVTKSQVMPTPLILNGTIYFDDGDGFIYALNATTGKLEWKLGPFGTANMASLDYVNLTSPIIVAGFSSSYPVNVSSIVGVSTNGKVVWRTYLPFTYDSGPGDAVMAVSGDYVVDGFISGYPIRHGILPNETLAREIVVSLNATNGRIIWVRNVSGYAVPTGANNGESPAIVHGIVMVNDRKDGLIMALNLSNGRLIWNDSLVKLAPGLIGPTYVDGYVLNPDFQYIQVINASTGKVVNLYPTGQDLVIDTPLVVGQTVIVDGGFGYVEAIPLYFVVHNTTSYYQILHENFVEP